MSTSSRRSDVLHQAFLEGVFLVGDEQTYKRLRVLVDEAISAHGLVRTKHGWRWDW